MDERDGRASSRRRTGPQGVSGAPARARLREQAPPLADVATPEEATALERVQADTTRDARELLDPRDPRTMERLRKRTRSGGYEIADTELVRAIRAWDARGALQAVKDLSELLVERCMPEIRRHAAGLRQRPDVMEDTIQDMILQLLTEARNPNEVFMTQNFIHYLRCLCVDNFNRNLRQEGLRYKRDEQGRPTGRPQHIPRALLEQIDLPSDDQDETGGSGSVIADPHDPYGERLAEEEAQRILLYLTDTLDRKIVALRSLYKLQWEEIAKLCGKTERTMRLRYEKARALLQERLRAEIADADSAGGELNI